MVRNKSIKELNEIHEHDQRERKERQAQCILRCGNDTTNYKAFLELLGYRGYKVVPKS